MFEKSPNKEILSRIQIKAPKDVGYRVLSNSYVGFYKKYGTQKKKKTEIFIQLFQNQNFF